MSSTCRHCGSALEVSFCNLGTSPLANSLIEPSMSSAAEKHYPLEMFVCSNCLLVQLDAFEAPDAIFRDYSYFSSFSDSWVAHARAYVEMISSKLDLGPASQVVEIASNDGYLLKDFVRRKVPALGIEPAINVAKAAKAAGVTTVTEFFGRALAKDLVDKGHAADLIVANNVLAHVPDLNDFVGGFKILLKPKGTLTIEFPHLLRLMEGLQFDTVYHEHFSYFSILAAEKLMATHGLHIFDVEQLTTHGGSLRLYVTHRENDVRHSDRVTALRDEEIRTGLLTSDGYKEFPQRVRQVRRDLLRFLLDAEHQGKVVVGYGAPAKAVTLLSYCGVGPDLIRFTVDRSPHKQGRLLPGSRLPIHAPDRIAELKPDYILIFPWNLKDEIISQLGHARSWGAKFVIPIPKLELIS